MGVALPPDVVASAGYRLVILMIVLLVAATLRRRTHWPVWMGAGFGLVSNLAYLTGNLSLAGLLGIPFLGATGWALIDYMRHDTIVLRQRLAAEEAAWSRERHDLRNDLAAKEAELFVLRDRADARDVRADDRDDRQDRREGRLPD